MTVISTETIYNELKDVLTDPKGPDGAGMIWSFCPCHPDGTKHGKRSLSLSPKRGLRCWAGCSFLEVVTALRQRLGVGLKPAPPSASSDLVAVYKYEDISGKVIAEHGRFERIPGQKTFGWRLPGGEWKEGLRGLPLADLPLYNAKEVIGRAGEIVYFVEGEKATDSCISHGLLAVTLAQGASGALPSAASLGVLSERDVYLWADNDAPGQELMTRLQAMLRNIARTTRYITSPINLPEKGDAFDYFRLGGTVEALRQHDPKEVVVEYKANDYLLLHYPTPSGLIHFDFEAIEKRRHSFETELTISLNGTGADSYSQRINLLSSSARTEMRRDLDELYGKTWGWTAILNRAIQQVRTAYASVDHALDAATMEVVPGQELFLVDSLLPFNSPTIMFGDGGSFKTYIAISLALHCAIGRDWFGATTPCLPVIYVDYEGTPQSFALRKSRLLAGMGIPELPYESLYYWPGRGMPLRDHVEALHRKIHDTGAVLVIVDTVGTACGGKPEDAEVALDYFRAVARLGVTTLNLAHITKKGEDQYPFGSVFWHNEARRTWYINRVQEEELPDLDIGLYCRKVNDGPKPRPQALSVHFKDPYGAVSISRARFSDIPELQGKLPPHIQIESVLTEAMTEAMIAEATNLSVSTVNRTLKGHPRLFLVTGAEDLTRTDKKHRPAQLWGRRNNQF